MSLAQLAAYDKHPRLRLLRQLRASTWRLPSGARNVDLARLLDVTPATIAAWKHGRSRPQPRHRARLELLEAVLQARD
jgi:hypothetical protein